MTFTRRSLLAAAPALASLSAMPPAFAADETRAERFIGKTDAKSVVNEYFSLTCTHCAAFALGPLKEIKEKLIDTGKVKWVFHDFPLDQLALTAAVVARYLPVDRYDPFINALFATQNAWAFNRSSDPTAQLWKTAALAGMSKETFDKAVADEGLKKWVLENQQADSKKWEVDSTPSFVINGKKFAGEMSYEAFAKLIPA